MKWWQSLTVDAQDNFSFKYYERPFESLTGREIEIIHLKHIRMLLSYRDTNSPDYCPDCASDLSYDWDVDDYDLLYHKCPTCGWDNGQYNPDL